MIRPSENESDNSLRLFFEQVYKPQKLRGKSSETMRLYKNTFSNFAKYLGHEPTFGDLRDETVSAFMGSFTDRGLSPETANKNANQILAVWRYAARKRFVDLEPDVELLPCPKRVPMGWLKPELESLFKAAASMDGMVGIYRSSVWWFALVHVVWFTGERIGAVLRIRWQDVDLDRGWILVPAEARKGKRADKMFPLPRQAVEAIRPLKRGPSDLVFEWDRCPTHIFKHYGKVLTRAGLPTDRRSKFHRIRRSTASHFKAAGGDPTELLDHADPRTTKKYLDPRICGGKGAADLLFDPTSRPGNDKATEGNQGKQNDQADRGES